VLLIGLPVESTTVTSNHASCVPVERNQRRGATRRRPSSGFSDFRARLKAHPPKC